MTMKINHLVSVIAILTFLASCAALRSKNDSPSREKGPHYRLLAGINHGGIVENTNMDEIENAPTDAVTGATKAGGHLGFHILFPLGKNKLETGADLQLSNQSLKYDDAVYNYQGERTIRLTQVIVPLTYNFGFFRNKNPAGLLHLKLGLAGLLNFSDISESKGRFPDCETSPFAGGMTLGIDLLPFSFKNEAKMGFYMDLYRGTQIYKDLYNKSEFEMKGTSFARGGVLYQF
jgi:hypothetical protein